ncbi:MAG: hypothetical protein ACOYMF_05245 [Bacteroidales bacterium]
MKAKISILTMLLLFTTILISSCHKFHDGSVVSKKVVEEHTYDYPTFHTINNITITIWQTGIAPTRYILEVENRQDSDTIKEKFCVSKTTFDCMQIGSYFNDTMPCEVYNKHEARIKR